MLYVDADNAKAVEMYKRLGFSIHSTNAAFVAEVAGRDVTVPDRLGEC